MSERTRRYNEKETRKILQRAAELQTRSIDGSKVGVGLEELKSAAAAVGLDPNLIAQAAAELEGSKRRAHRVEIERVLPGELTDDRWLLMVMELRRLFGKPGETNRLGRAHEWSSKDDEGTVHFSAIPTPNGIRVRLTSEYGMALASGWIIASVAALILSMVAAKFAMKAAGVGLGALAFFVVLAAVAFVTWYVISRMEQKHSDECEQIVSKLSDAEVSPLMTATPVQIQEDVPLQQENPC